MSKDSRIFEEIEATAGFYGPSLYAGLADVVQGLLTHFHDLTIFEDADGFGYTPMTAVKYDPQQTKLFAVGVIAPSANVTGRILDRSASVAKKVPVGGEIVTSTPDETNQGVSTPQPSSSGKHTREELLQDSQFWVEYVLMCQRIGVDPVELAKVLQYESQFNPSNRSPANAKGLPQFMGFTASISGMSKEDFARLDQPGGLSGIEQIPYMETYFKRLGAKGKSAAWIFAHNLGGYNLPTGQFGYGNKAYFDSLTPAQQESLRKKLAGYKTTVEGMYNKYDANKAADLIPPGDQNNIVDSGDTGRRMAADLKSDVAAAIEQALGAVGAGASSQLSQNGGTTEKWKEEGSKDAKTAQKETEKIAGVPLNQTDMGKKLQAAQRQAIAEAQNAIDGMKRLPPLRLLVNPKQFGVKGSKIVADGNWSRRGPIIEHWGDEQDVISASGKVAAFYTAETGLSRSTRQFSQSWRNLQSLYLLYKNNGGVYLRDPFDPSGGSQRLTYVGSIYIYYDGILYVGSFTSFNITESDATPFTVEYSFEFNVRAAFILDRPDSKYDINFSQKQNASKLLPTSSETPPEKTTPVIKGKKSTSTEEEDLTRAIWATEAARQSEVEEKEAKDKEVEKLFNDARAVTAGARWAQDQEAVDLFNSARDNTAGARK